MQLRFDVGDITNVFGYAETEKSSMTRIITQTLP